MLSTEPPDRARLVAMAEASTSGRLHRRPRCPVPRLTRLGSRRGGRPVGARGAVSPGTSIHLCLGRALLRSDRHRPSEAIRPDRGRGPAPGQRRGLVHAGARPAEGPQARAGRGRLPRGRDRLSRGPAAIRATPGRAYLGVVLFLRGQMAEARDLLDAIRPGESESAIALQARGILAFELGDIDLAERCSRAAMGREPRFVGAHLLLGRALANRGSFSEGGDVLRRARDLGKIGDNEARKLGRARPV
ncbi:MAG: tetratricopeptide repeat protein [Singulisphaera sp.]